MHQSLVGDAILVRLPSLTSNRLRFVVYSLCNQVWRLWVIWDRNIWLTAPFVRPVLQSALYSTDKRGVGPPSSS
jgi:hypothetical protein